MQNSIQTIVNDIPKGYIFDSHFIINELIKRFSDQYFTFISKFAKQDEINTFIVHGQIGIEINKLDSIKQIGKAWSENIHKKPSECTCWEKL